MKIHEKNITKSISTNIIGTANIVNACNKFKIKLIYFSTNYVYPGIKNYSENDPLLPINNYAISKLGENARFNYIKITNSKIMYDRKPFVHKKAFNDVEMNFMFHEDLAKHLLKLIDYNGINVGDLKNSFNFAKTNDKILSISAKKVFGKNFLLNKL